MALYSFVLLHKELADPNQTFSPLGPLALSILKASGKGVSPQETLQLLHMTIGHQASHQPSHPSSLCGVSLYIKVYLLATSTSPLH